MDSRPWSRAASPCWAHSPTTSPGSLSVKGLYRPLFRRYDGYLGLVALNNQNTGIDKRLPLVGNTYRTWFTEPNGNRAGLLITHKESSHVITLFEIPLPGTHSQQALLSIPAARHGSPPGTNAILAWRSPYFNQTFLPTLFRPRP